MKIIPPYLKKNFSYNPSNAVLGTLLVLDVILICVHLGVGFYIYISGLDSWNTFNTLFVTSESGFGEYFQYLKYMVIIGCLLYLIFYRRMHGYFLWLFLFGAFFLDDSLQLHEQIGQFSKHNLNYEPLLGIRKSHLAELTFAISAISVFFVWTVLTYVKSGPGFKRITLNIGLLVVLFLCFGVGMDVAHGLTGDNVYLGFIFGLTEDGGEMLVLSLLVWYFLFLALRAKEHSAKLLFMNSKWDKE